MPLFCSIGPRPANWPPSPGRGRIGPVNWTPALIRKAVIWLSLKVEKALLKLSDDDFREHELYELLREYGPASVLGRRVFDELMATLCTEPGGPRAVRRPHFQPASRRRRYQHGRHAHPPRRASAIASTSPT